MMFHPDSCQLRSAKVLGPPYCHGERAKLSVLADNTRPAAKKVSKVVSARRQHAPAVQKSGQSCQRSPTTRPCCPEKRAKLSTFADNKPLLPRKRAKLSALTDNTPLPPKSARGGGAEAPPQVPLVPTVACMLR